MSEGQRSAPHLIRPEWNKPQRPRRPTEGGYITPQIHLFGIERKPPPPEEPNEGTETKESRNMGGRKTPELEASTSTAAEPFSSINLELASHQKIEGLANGRI